MAPFRVDNSKIRKVQATEKRGRPHRASCNPENAHALVGNTISGEREAENGLWVWRKEARHK